MAEKPFLLAIGIDPQVEKLFSSSFANTDFQSIAFNFEKLIKPMNPPPAIIIASAPSLEEAIELGQVLRASYLNIPIFLCCKPQDKFERKNFIRNGFTDSFLLPIEASSFKIALNEAISNAGSEVKVYRSVKLIDLEAGDRLEFDTTLFLASNKKYVKICHAGDEIDADRLRKIKQHKINNLFVPSDQIQKFYEYSGKKLRKMNSGGTFGATERREKLSVAVRDLMSGMFSQEATSYQTGQDVLKTCGGIISSFIVQGAEAEWFLRIQQVIGDFGDSYSHASNVSTLSALFSMGTGIGKPEDLALAGLLHDLGKSQLPEDIQALEADQMNPAQLALYKKHPEMSIDLIKQKKIIVPDVVTKAVLQHHECFNGTGFPFGISGDRICPEAQILALANKFDHLTKLIPGRPLVTPFEAVATIKKEQTSDPSKVKFKVEIVKNLLKLFPEAI